MRRLSALLAAVAIAVVGAGCTSEKVKANEVAVLIERGSRVLVGERGEGLRLAQGRRILHLGAQVKVLEGSASIALHDGSQLEVRKGSEVAVGRPVVLVAEDLLVTSASKPLLVTAAGSQFSVDGVAKLSRDLAVSAAAYRGRVAVKSAGRTLTIPALRQAAAASLGVLPAEPVALDYDPADAWDRRFLGAAIDLGEELEAKSEGFTRSLRPGEGHTPGFYRLLIPDLEAEPAFGEELVADQREPGDLLVGATIAVSGRLGSFADRWANVFEFRGKGARWGLVALDQQVNDLQGVVASVDAAIGRQQFDFALPSAPASTPAPAAPATASRPVEPPAPATPPRPAPQPTTSGRAPSPVPAAPVPVVTLPPLLPAPEPTPPTEGILTPLLDSVTATLDGLLSGR